MQVAIKFTKSGANAVVGGFSPSDIARVDAAFAKHLVDEARVAVYDGAAPVDQAADKPLTKAEKKAVKAAEAAAAEAAAAEAAK